MLKKTIILSDNDNQNRGLATLTIENISKGTFATIKPYNLKSDAKTFVLGVSANNKCSTYDIFLSSEIYRFKIDANISKPIACVLFDTDRNILLKGATSSVKGDYVTPIVKSLTLGKTNNEKVLEDNDTESYSTEAIDEDSVENLSATSLKANIISELFEEDSNTELEEKIDRAIDTPSIKEIFDSANNGLATPFFDNVRDEVMDLFEHYPRDSELEDMIPNSKWVRVDYNNDGRNYVLGLIYEYDVLKYLAYGVPMTKKGAMPNDLQGYGRWVPCDADRPNEAGYYMVYQDVTTGKNIEL